MKSDLGHTYRGLPQWLSRLLMVVLLLVGSSFGVAQTVTGHPRLWLRAEDLPRLRSWAVSSNPMYQNGLALAAAEAISTYDSLFFPNGQPASPWPDEGTVNWVHYSTEAYAQFFAFMSLIERAPETRDHHAQRARNLLMYLVNEAVKGQGEAPFRYVNFSTGDRARYFGEGFGLTVDWIHPYLTAQDKATIRAVFLRWCDELNRAYRSPANIANGELPSERWAANNYYTGYMRNITLMALSFDAADDPPLDPGRPPTELGNTLRSYISNATSNWLSYQFAIFDGDGSCSGGLHPEGPFYGLENLGFFQHALLALHTAGYHDQSVAGPQIQMISSSYWDQVIEGYLHSITPSSFTPPEGTGFEGSPPVYQMANYGDIYRFWVTDAIDLFGCLGIYDQLTGNVARLATIRWIQRETPAGGPGQLHNRAANIWGNSEASAAIEYFMLFDPAAPPSADPRPVLPLSFYSAPLGRILARTDWTPEASWFSFICAWNTIDHQLGCGNQFEFYRKGEWLTKELSGYAEEGFLPALPEYHNTLSLQNDTPTDMAWFEPAIVERGGQWLYVSPPDPSVTTSLHGDFVYATGNATHLYNRPGASDILHASRSIVWLKPDYTIIYDRAISARPNRFKRFNLCLPVAPMINGSLATMTTATGQHLFIHTILPTDASISTLPVEEMPNDSVATLDPIRARLRVEDVTNPQSVRFLHVLQGADQGTAPDPVQLVESTAGAAFAGARVGSALVLFLRDIDLTVAGFSYEAPLSTVTHIITGLIPKTGYQITTELTQETRTVTIEEGGPLNSDDGGVLLWRVPNPLRPSLSIQLMPGNQLRLRVQGNPNVTYQILTSVQLLQWHEVASETTNEQGFFDWEGGTLDGMARFFQAATVP